MSNGEFKETLSYGDCVKIYYSDNTETYTTYLGYFRMPDDSVSYKPLDIFGYNGHTTDCVYFSNKWISIGQLFVMIHRNKSRGGWISVEYEFSNGIKIPIWDFKDIDITNKPRYSYNGLEIAMFQYGNLLNGLEKYNDSILGEELVIPSEYEITYSYKNRNGHIDCGVNICDNCIIELEHINELRQNYYLDKKEAEVPKITRQDKIMANPLFNIRSQEDAKLFIENSFGRMSKEEKIDLAKIYFGINDKK